MSNSSSSTFSKFREHPIGVHWRKALVNLPRIVPDHSLKYTNPEGPYPVIIKIPSRGKHLIPLYVFIPKMDSLANPMLGVTRDLPVVLDFHGGGFVLGSCLEQAPFCAKLARELNCIAISVDYRLGPYDKFPAALEDAEDVLAALLEETKPGYIELRDEINKAIRCATPQIASDDSSISSSSTSTSKERPDFLRTSTNVPKSTTRPEVMRTSTNASIMSTKSMSTKSKRPGLGRSITGRKRTSKGDPITLDISRIALSGFSSGGNLALNLVTSVAPPQLPKAWPSVVPKEYPHSIAVLLYYPSFDTRLLPSERPRPEGLPISTGFFAGLRLEDELMPTYITKEMALSPRASPGLADVSGIHEQARMQLILPELDSLNEQSEVWVKKVIKDGRGHHVQVDRILGVKHGWTQFPDGWLSDADKKKKVDIFDKTVEFMKRTWSDEPIKN